MKRVLSLCSIILLLITFTLPAFAQIEVEDEGYYQKFQGQNISINVYNWGEYISDGAEEGTINAVSYTHLDVYKRQLDRSPSYDRNCLHRH